MKSFFLNNQVSHILNDLFTVDRIRPQRLVFVNVQDEEEQEKDNVDRSFSARRKEQMEAEAKKGEEAKLKRAAPVIELKSDMAEKIVESIGSSAAAIKEAEKHKNSRLASSIKDVQKSLKDLQPRVEESTKPVILVLKKLADQYAITNEEAKEILNLDASLPDYQSRLKELTEPLKEVADSKLVEKLVSAKNFEAAKFKGIQKEFIRIFKNLKDAIEQMGNYIYQEAFKERAIKEHGDRLGFELKKGNVLRLKFKRPMMRIMKSDKGKKYSEQLKDKDGNLMFEPVYRKVEIKDVAFRDSHFNGPDGKKIKMPSLSPFVTIDVEDEWPDKNGDTEKHTLELSAERLSEVVDEGGMTERVENKENIEDELKDLSARLGVDVKVGSEFEYRSQFFGEKGLAGKDNKVKIVSISKEKDDFLDDSNSQKDYEHTIIELDKEIVTRYYPTQEKTKKLTLGKFIRWYRRMGTTSSLLTMDELKNKLRDQNEERNSKYNRSPEQYPPIDLIQGEMLYYDTTPPKLFPIKEITDKEIVLDDGSEKGNRYTPASFLRWTEKNEVEKMTADAEGKKRAAMIEDPEEKKEEEEKARKEAERRMKARIEAGKPDGDKPANDNALTEKEFIEAAKKGKLPKGNYVLESSETSSPPSTSYLRKLYSQTYFMRLSDFYEIGKEIYEYILRYLDRTTKERIGVVGKKTLGSFIPPLGAEFETIRQKAENEQVNHYKEAYDQFGYMQLQERMAQTRNSDELKAILTVESEKGFIRWNDKTLWSTLVRIAPNYNLDLSKAEHNEDSIRKIIDTFWGEDSFRELKNKNDSAYQSKVSDNLDVAKRLENDPEQRGGMKARLQDMLLRHLNGEFVEAAEYEGILFFAIQAGKMGFGDKIYFMMMALGMRGKPGTANEGKSLMDFSRLSHCEGELLNNFPILDYFTDEGLVQKNADGKTIIDKKTGKPKIGQITEEGIQCLIKQYVKPDLGMNINSVTNARQLQPGNNLMRFIEREMILNDMVQVRLAEKSSRDIENWDHDDHQYFVSQLGESQIEQVLQRSGAKQQASIAGVKNAYAGLNHYTKIHMEEYIKSISEGNTDKAQKSFKRMTNTIRSFIKLDGIADKRLFHGNGDFSRLTTEKNSFALADQSKSRTVLQSNQEIYSFMVELFSRLKNKAASDHSIPMKPFDDVIKTWDIMMSNFGPTQKKKQAEQTEAFDRFGKEFEGALSTMQDKIGDKEIATIMMDIQNNTVGGGKKLIKGIMEHATDKKDVVEAEAQAFEFKKVEAANITQLALELKNLRNAYSVYKSKTPEEIEAEETTRVNHVLEVVEQERFNEVTGEDEGLLLKEIHSLKQKMGMEDAEDERAEMRQAS